MDLDASAIATISSQLLPGFLTAWIFYSLTAHPKPSPFERVIQALIFTMIVQALVILFQQGLFLAGEFVSVGYWTSDARLVWSVALACVLGLVSSRLTNDDSLHSVLRRFKWTTRYSSPSEWFSAFRAHKDRWVILHLSGQRRLYGWPERCPDQSGQGHFLIDDPEWLLPDGSRAPLPWVARMLVPASEVESVEFLEPPGTVDESSEEAREAKRILLDAQGEQHVNCSS
jgi:hypothetical protein